MVIIKLPSVRGNIAAQLLVASHLKLHGGKYLNMIKLVSQIYLKLYSSLFFDKAPYCDPLLKQQTSRGKVIAGKSTILKGPKTFTQNFTWKYLEYNMLRCTHRS